MPIYEYRCKDCGQKVSLLVKSIASESVPSCPNCGGNAMQKLISVFAYHRSVSSRLEEIDTSKPRGEDYYKDSRNVGLWAKKRVRELGADSETVRQVDEVVDRAAEKALSGKLFDEIS